MTLCEKSHLVARVTVEGQLCVREEMGRNPVSVSKHDVSGDGRGEELAGYGRRTQRDRALHKDNTKRIQFCWGKKAVAFKDGLG